MKYSGISLIMSNNGYDPDELLTVKKLAEITHVSVPTIRRYIRDYKIPSLKHKNGYRGAWTHKVRREDWRRFLFQGYNNAAK